MKSQTLLSAAVTLAVIALASAPALAEDLTPDLVGLDAKTATTLLDKAGVTWVVMHYDPARPAGRVCSQKPSGFAPLRGARIELTIGGDAPAGWVPRDAEKIAEPAAPILPTPPTGDGQPEVLEPDVAPPSVATDRPMTPTDPQPTNRPAGVLDLPAARVPSTAGPKIPSVLGDRFDSARRELGEWRVIRENTVAVPELVGKVVNQWPTPSNTLASGETVIVVVAIAKRESDQHRYVPNVNGKSILDTKSELEATGFNVRFETVESDAAKFGRVVWQRPMPGSMLPLGGGVVVHVGRGTDGGTEPDPVEPAPIVEAAPEPMVPDSMTPEPPPVSDDDLPTPPTGVDEPTSDQPSEAPTEQPREPDAPKVVLPKPKLISPPKGESYPRAYGATFEWSKVRGATSYELEVQAEQPSGDWESVDTHTIEEGTRHRPKRMERGRFRWRVRAFSEKHAGTWSGWFRLYMY